MVRSQHFLSGWRFFFHGFRLVEGGLLKGILGMYKCIFQTHSASYHWNCHHLPAGICWNCHVKREYRPVLHEISNFQVTICFSLRPPEGLVATPLASSHYIILHIYICSFFSNHQRCYVAEWWTQYYIYLVIVKEMHCQLGKLKQIRTKLLSTSSIKDPPNKNSHQLFFLGMETSKKHWWYLKHQTCDVCPSKPETASDSSDSSVPTRWEP